MFAYTPLDLYNVQFRLLGGSKVTIISTTNFNFKASLTLKQLRCSLREQIFRYSTVHLSASESVKSQKAFAFYICSSAGKSLNDRSSMLLNHCAAKVGLMLKCLLHIQHFLYDFGFLIFLSTSKHRHQYLCISISDLYHLSLSLKVQQRLGNGMCIMKRSPCTY